jgi:hypothetical protein
MENGKDLNVKLDIITAKNNNKRVIFVGKVNFLNNNCVKIYGLFQDITESVNRQNELESTN